MAKSGLFIMICALSINVKCQKSTIISVEKRIEEGQYENAIELAYSIISGESKGNKSRAYQLAADSYFYLDQLDNSLQHYYLATLSSKTIPFEKNKHLTECYGNLAYCYLHMGKYNQAIPYYDTLYLMADQFHDTTEMATARASKGKIRMALGQYKLATDLFLDAYQLDSASKDTIGLAYDLSNLGVVNTKIENYKKAIEYLQEALKVKSSIGNNPLMMVQRKLNLADAYLGNKDYRLAKKLNTNIISELIKLGYKNELQEAHMQRSRIYLQLGKLDSAEAYGIKPYNYHSKGRLSSFQVESGLNYTNILISNGKNRMALSVLKELDQLKEINLPINLKNFYLLKAKALEQLNEKAEALSYYQSYWKIAQEDGLQNQELALQELDKKYQTSRQLQQIEILEKENQVKELEVKTQKRNQLILFLLLLAVGLLTLIVYVLYIGRKRNLNLLTSRNQALERLDETKNKLFAIVSHDLKNPVSAFRNMTDALVENFDELPKEKTYDYLQKMSRNALAVENQLNDLLLWASQQIKAEEISVRKIDLKPLVNEVFDLINPMAEQQNIQLSCHIDPGFSLTSHPELLKTVIRNLLTNGIKFTERGGVVQLDARMKNQFPEISIKDTGIGMSEQELALLFDLKKSDRIGSSPVKGTGIGLSICKEIIEKLNGNISVHSRVNEGTVFSLRFSN